MAAMESTKELIQRSPKLCSACAVTLVGPVLGAWMIKYFENIFSAFNGQILTRFFDFLPEGVQQVVVTIASKIVGEGWNLTLGLVFVLIVVFLPGGIMEGVRPIANPFGNSSKAPGAPAKLSTQPGE
jgi:hypothetical protein